MKEREEDFLGGVRIPGEGGELRLFRKGREFSLRVHGTELMNSLVHDSEDSLAKLVCGRLGHLAEPVLLIGGLGMGFTLAAALKAVGPKARVIVAELIPGVVEWNRGPLAHLAGRPLEDARVAVRVQDVALSLQTEEAAFDGILLDVDNGPEGLTRRANDWLYSDAGLRAARESLRPRGVLALWSSKPNRDFLKRLRKAGFDADEISARGRDRYRGAHYTVWVAERLEAKA